MAETPRKKLLINDFTQTSPSTPAKKQSPVSLGDQSTASKPPAPLKKPAVRATKQPKPVESKSETIPVTISKSPKPAAPPKITKFTPPVDDIPEDLFPSADELSLQDAATKPAKSDDADAHTWLEELDESKIPPKPAPAKPAAITTNQPLSTSDNQSKKATEAEIKAELEAPAEEKIDLHQPEDQEAIVEEDADEGKLEGFIYGSSKPGSENGAGVHPEGQTARENLDSPKIYDTSTVHLPISRSRPSAHAGGDVVSSEQESVSFWTGLAIVLAVLLLVGLVYVAIDLGMLGDGVKVPFHIFKQS